MRFYVLLCSGDRSAFLQNYVCVELIERAVFVIILLLLHQIVNDNEETLT